MKTARLTAALLAAGLALPALAGPKETELLEKLLARMEKLEARNAELEKEVKALKGESEALAAGLDSPRLSENEPELTVRLKAVEKDALNMKKAAKIAEGLDGIKVGASLATVGQKAFSTPEGIENGTSQLNYRADVSVELPLNPVSDIEHKLFAHLRFGQGLGLNAAFSRLVGPLAPSRLEGQGVHLPQDALVDAGVVVAGHEEAELVVALQQLLGGAEEHVQVPPG